MGLSKPIIIANSEIDISNLATKGDLAGMKGIKSIQSGTCIPWASNTNNYFNVPISEVDPSKCIVKTFCYFHKEFKLVLINQGSFYCEGFVDVSNTLGILRNTGSTAYDTVTVKWLVIELQ